MQAQSRGSTLAPALQLVRPRVESPTQERPATHLQADCLPRHVAIIMDGNGRWARQRGMSRNAGHRAGTENLRRVLERFCECGVPYLTIYAFSTENWRRPRREVVGLLRLPARYLKRELKQLHANGIRLRHLGHLEGLDPSVQQQVREAVELTKSNNRLTLSIAFNYGGRREIVDAVRRIAADGLPPEAIDEAAIAARLDTAELPDPDLVIRTAGEMRLSNFLLWQAAYAEYYSTPVYWPDFGPDEIDAALTAYASRTRRYGGVVAEEARSGSSQR